MRAWWNWQTRWIRFQWISVQVQVLSPAPYRVFITDLTVVDTRFFIHAFYIEEIVGIGAFLLICCIYQIYLL